MRHNVHRRSASCGAFRRRSCRRPRTFWHCPKGSWTSKRLAFLCAGGSDRAERGGGFRWAPRDRCGLAAHNLFDLTHPVTFVRGNWVWDEMFVMSLFQQQDQGAGHLGAARLCLCAMSAPSYLSAPPAHPVEPRARRGNCLPAHFQRDAVHPLGTRARSPRFAPFRFAGTMRPPVLLQHRSLTHA